MSGLGWIGVVATSSCHGDRRIDDDNGEGIGWRESD